MKKPSDFHYHRYVVDLAAQTVTYENRPCEDMEDVLGGIARGFKYLAAHDPVEPYAPEAPLLMSLGALSGTSYMTGLRTFFQGYSPLKGAKNGKSATMWSAGSGKFGVKLRTLGADDVVFVGKAAQPTIVRMSRGVDEAHGGDIAFEFLDGSELWGKRVHAKMMALHERYDDAHFAVIGPAGENYEACRFASVALSTVNELKSGEPKARFCGRGGFGGVMGSKNLVAIVADVEDVAHKPTKEVKAINLDIAKGAGSRRYRDPKRSGGLGGTWSIYGILNPIASMPEENFNPTGTEASAPLHREVVEEGPYVVKDESCFACGIRCHKNVYDEANGKPGKFRAKLDYEPLNLLSSNLGIYDVEPTLDLIALCDDLGMDAISLGATIGYAMDYNRRRTDDAEKILDGITFGDAEKALALVEAVGTGKCVEIGQGTMRLSRAMGETEYAMHSKGVEYPAYLPHTNPGYPWALAGGHMSMRTYLLIVFERETGMDYWVEAITERGPMAMRDDIIGICKFARSSDETAAEAIQSLLELDVTADDLKDAVRRTYLRGYKMERDQGFDVTDYELPAIAHQKHEHIDAPYFNTPEFFEELRGKVLAKFDQMLASESL